MLRFFHLINERATIALFPLIFYVGGMATTRSFYKSSLGGPLPLLPALALKTPLPPNSSAAAFLTPSCKAPSFPLSRGW